MAGKADIVNHLVDNLEGLTKKQAGEAVDAILDYIRDCLSGDDKVQLPGFGTFQVAHRKARQGRNPQSGKTITIPASKGVNFKAGKSLKDAVNG
jgi:DNA-binding protein HU-beta